MYIQLNLFLKNSKFNPLFLLRQRIQNEERLKKEEEERNERRKRVEAIMLRTRGRGQSNSSARVNEYFFKINLW